MMLCRAIVATGIAFLVAVLVPVLPAQDAPAMLATGRYLFVLRGDVLLQFDVDTLQLRHKVRLDQADPPAPVAAAPLGSGIEAEAPMAQSPLVSGRMAARGGGGAAKATAAAIAAGLQWLARHQDDDGKWDADGFMKHDEEGEICDGPGNPVHDVGVTGLAMLAMLGDGSTLRSGPYRANLLLAAKWLRDQQGDNGRFGTNASHDFIYDHAIATYAMCEAYGLSGYKLLRPVAQNAIDYLESHRNPYSVWRYQPRDNDNDTSVTSWCLVASESGRFFGLDVNENARKLGLTWLDQVTTPDGRIGYTKAGEPSSRHPGDHGTRFPVAKGEAMTAAGLFCRFFLGQAPANVPIMRASADLVLSKPPVWDEKAGTIDEYYWYYGTHAMFQMGGRHWAEWSKKLTTALLGSQRTDGNAAGSWDPIGVWGADGGRVCSTALLVMSLQADHRYAKLVR